jgi:hypothetical protein
MRDVIEAEAALHAQPLVIRGPSRPSTRTIVLSLHVIGQLAADAAVRAHRRHLLVGRHEIGVLRRRERARRARLHAFAARDARRGAHRIVEIEHDLRMPPRNA